LHDLFLDLYDFKIFVDVSEEIRLNRRLKRDVEERGRIKEKVLKRWNEFVQPMYLKHIESQRVAADLILRNG